jgi:hypothetical protein
MYFLELTSWYILSSWYVSVSVWRGGRDFTNILGHRTTSNVVNEGCSLSKFLSS